MTRREGDEREKWGGGVIGEQWTLYKMSNWIIEHLRVTTFLDKNNFDLQRARTVHSGDEINHDIIQVWCSRMPSFLVNSDVGSLILHLEFNRLFEDHYRIGCNASPVRTWLITFSYTQQCNWVVASNLSHSIRLIRSALHSIDPILPSESGRVASARSLLTSRWCSSDESCANTTVEQESDGWMALKGEIVNSFGARKFHVMLCTLLLLPRARGEKYQHAIT